MDTDDLQTDRQNAKLSIKYLQNSLRARMIENLRNVQHNTWVFNLDKSKKEKAGFDYAETSKSELYHIASELSILSKQLTVNTLETANMDKDETYARAEQFVARFKQQDDYTPEDKESLFKFEIAAEEHIIHVLRSFFLKDLDYLYQASTLLALKQSERKDVLFCCSNLYDTYYIRNLNSQRH